MHANTEVREASSGMLKPSGHCCRLLPDTPTPLLQLRPGPLGPTLNGGEKVCSWALRLWPEALTVAKKNNSRGCVVEIQGSVVPAVISRETWSGLE